MRALADAERIRRFMTALADRARVDGRVYFTGGVTAVRAYFAEIEPQLYRYPAVDPASFRRAVSEAFGTV